MKKILIIGGCGYIGSGLFLYLQEKNYHVDTVDLEWFGNNVNPHNIKQDFASLTQQFIETYDTVLLLAGHSSVKMCENNMQSAFENNVANFVSLLSKITPLQQFIYASSSSVYNNANSEACTEDLNLASNPTNWYDLTKREIDWYAALSGKQYYSLRLGTVNGYAPNLRIDLMMNAMSNSANTNAEISLFNAQIQRPILGMQDLCRAVESILITSGEKSGIYNLASFNSTAGEIANAVGTYYGVPVVHKEHSGVVVNTKLQTATYDFKINSEKFCRTFDFTFIETATSILESLKERSSATHKATRADAITYER